MTNDRLPDASTADRQREFERRAELTDLANAQRLFSVANGRFVWIEPWKSWFKYESGQWEKTKAREIDGLAGDVARQIMKDASAAINDQDFKQFGKWALESHSHVRQNAMIERAKHMLAFDPDDFDANNEVLNVKNGTLDLRSQSLRSSEPGDYITNQAGCDYDPEASCPRWNKFLFEIFDADSEYIELWQCLFGACLLGEPGFERFPVLYGTGANGKSTLLGVLTRLMGDYAKHARSTVFTSVNDDPQGFNIHALRGARVVTASEANRGQKLNLGLIKEMTGGESIRSAPKYGDSSEFIPVWHLFFSSNHKPTISGQDKGTWRRILYLPFKQTIPKSRQRPFELFLDWLCEELPGILNWALIGLKDYLDHGGLQVPQSIELENESYKAEQDQIGEWLGSCCVQGSGLFAPLGDLYANYLEFNTRINGGHPLGKRSFGDALDEHEIHSFKGSGGARMREGIELIKPDSGVTNNSFQSQSGATRPKSQESVLDHPHEENFWETPFLTPLTPQSHEVAPVITVVDDMEPMGK